MSDFTELKVGDVVRLRSGGPEMTVVSVGPKGKFVGACWFPILHYTYLSGGSMSIASSTTGDHSPDHVAVYGDSICTVVDLSADALTKVR